MQRRDGQGYLLNAQALTAQEMWLHKFALPRALGAETLEPERLADLLKQSRDGARHTFTEAQDAFQSLAADLA